MSYQTITICSKDQDIRNRVQAAIVQEQNTRDVVPQPLGYLDPMVWLVSSASDVEAAYASALAANHSSPGADDAVVTDGMILANVQTNYEDVDLIVHPPQPVIPPPENVEPPDNVEPPPTT